MIKPNLHPYKLGLLIIMLLVSSMAMSQSKKQQQLEEQRQEYARQIRQFERLMLQGKKEQHSILSNVENLDYKIAVRQNLIKITNQQANLLTREINNNQKEITNLRDRLEILKQEYAAMIVKSYKSRSEESKVMFLLSSTNFQQAYKRLQYLKQYANYQKRQSEEIKLKTIKLQELNTSLIQQKKEKQKLIDANRNAKSELDKELKQFEVLRKSIDKDIKKYSAQIKTRQQEIDKIDREIQKIIREAIANSNRKAGRSTSSKEFALTPEEKTLAANFVANKGKLPWPVEKGVITSGYGKRRSRINKTSEINNNGIQISTEKAAKVRAVFSGVVLQVMIQKNGNNIVMLRHGDYITAYKNLSKIYVKKGDKVETKQVLGEVRTNKSRGETILGFYVLKGTQKQNPAYWIKR